MPIYNPNDVVIIQRTSDSSSFVEHVLNASPNSYLFFDSSSFLVSITASSIGISASYSSISDYSISASYAPIPILVPSSSWVSATVKITSSDTASYVDSASYYPAQTYQANTTSASFASSSISSSYSPVEPIYSASISSQLGTKQDTLTNTLYTITASNADKLDGLDSSSFQATLIAGNIYNITSSWAITSSYSTGSVIGFGIDTILYITSASYAALSPPLITTLYIITSSI